MPDVRLAALLLAMISTTGCGSSEDRIVVFAASSLTDAFERIEAEFEVAHPGIDIVVNYGGSSALVAQIADGAPADVLATADREQMRRAVSELSVRAVPEVFATNTMVIAVEHGNPLGITGLDELPSVPVVVLAAPEVPAGVYASQVLDCAGVEVEPASFEPSVRSVATKVALGEADAGLVYLTDVDERLTAVPIDDACNVRAEYPIVVLGADPAAHTFTQYVLGSAGAAALTDAGFGRP